MERAEHCITLRHQIALGLEYGVFHGHGHDVQCGDLNAVTHGYFDLDQHQHVIGLKNIYSVAHWHVDID